MVRNYSAKHRVVLEKLPILRAELHKIGRVEHFSNLTG